MQEIWINQKKFSRTIIKNEPTLSPNFFLIYSPNKQNLYAIPYTPYKMGSQSLEYFPLSPCAHRITPTRDGFYSATLSVFPVPQTVDHGSECVLKIYRTARDVMVIFLQSYRV